MVRELSSKEFKSFKCAASRFDVIEELRDEGAGLGKRYHKAPLVPEEEDIRALWADADLDPVEPTEELQEQLATLELVNYYPFPILQWAKAFYRFVAEPLRYKQENTGVYEYLLYFSLLYPPPRLPNIPFYQAIELLWDIKARVIRGEVVKHIVEKDGPALVKLVDWEAVDWKYTALMPYQTLRRRVLEEFERTPAFQRARAKLKITKK